MISKKLFLLFCRIYFFISIYFGSSLFCIIYGMISLNAFGCFIGIDVKEKIQKRRTLMLSSNPQRDDFKG
jgi:hypothetical protein